jgi:hypothetical protein
VGGHLKIVVAGFAVGFPLGGQLYMMLHYVLGLTRLGHEVIFLENTDDWASPFDPVLGYHTSDSSRGRAMVEALFANHGLEGRFVYDSELEGKLYGIKRADLNRFCADADLFLNISGICPLREPYMRCRTKAVIDTDPAVTQVRISRDAARRVYFAAHDAHFTYGLNIPSGRVGVPLSGFDWKPLLPPVLLDLWPVAHGSGQGYSTIGSWDAQGRDVEIGGRVLTWSKKKRYETLLRLPERLPGVPLMLAMSGMKKDAARYVEAGWEAPDGLEVSRDLDRYRDYIRSSRAELTVVKEVNATLKSGWFSDRSACYLASGRPVITGDTGFSTALPVGEGLFAFETLDEAMTAIKAVEAAPEKYGARARELAEEHFDAEKVLTGLLGELGLA